MVINRCPCSRKATIILANASSTPRDPDWCLLWSHPLHFLSLGLGTGLAPTAPGTAGSLLGFPLFWLLTGLPVWQQHASLLMLFLLGIWCCQVTGKALGVSDHGAIVWDEVVAMAWVLVSVPVGLYWGLAAFGLFRLFDIWKPFPIAWVDARVKGGLGVMLDDVLAAAMAIAVLQVAKGFF